VVGHPEVALGWASPRIRNESASVQQQFPAFARIDPVKRRSRQKQSLPTSTPRSSLHGDMLRHQWCAQCLAAFTRNENLATLLHPRFQRIEKVCRSRRAQNGQGSNGAYAPVVVRALESSSCCPANNPQRSKPFGLLRSTIDTGHCGQCFSANTVMTARSSQA
jgi:hypothetical protein